MKNSRGSIRKIPQYRDKQRRYSLAETDGKELVFMGKITRTVAHEMTNILAAVGENAALIQDVLFYSGSGAVPAQERISRAFRTIEHQITRGVELASRLNRFAHGTDEPKTTIDLNIMLSQIGSFGERLARLKGCGLRVVPSDRPLELVSNPISIQMAIFECLEFVLDHLETRITVVMRSRGLYQGAVEVDFSPDVPSHGVDLDVKGLSSLPQWTALERSIERVGGKLAVEDASGWFSVVFASNLT